MPDTNFLPRKKQRYGWVPDLPDYRDLKLSAPAPTVKLPAHADLAPTNPPIYNQDALGSCTANGIARCIQYAEGKEKLPWSCPSRLFIYYNERFMEGTIDSDSGAQIRDGIKSLTQWGYAHEDMWPYDITKFTHQPPPNVFAAAKKNLVKQYARVVQSGRGIKSVLSSGFPVVFGFTVYESMESAAVANGGMLPMPSDNEPVVGGHCVVLVGYDDVKRLYKVANSWGAHWGDNGYFYMPYEYVESPGLAQDFWVINYVPA